MRQERQVGIVMPARNEWSIAQSGGLLEKILQDIPHNFRPQVYVCVNNSDPAFVETMKDVVSQDDRIKMVDLGNPMKLGWAYAYLYGLKWAAEDNSEYVIEMDANGAHKPDYIPQFLNSLEGASAALSSRFTRGGGIEKYPFQRRVISKSGTIASNLILGLGTWVDDMTSGYEAFRKEVLGDIFSTQPIEKWISATRGPGHFYQTEMRTLVIWRGYDFEIVPIVWGNDRTQEPVKIPLKTVLNAFQSLLILRARKGKLSRK